MPLPAGYTLEPTPAAPATPAAQPQGGNVPAGYMLEQPSTQAAAPQAAPSMLQQVGSTVGDLATGFGKSAAESIHSTGQWLHDNVNPIRLADEGSHKTQELIGMGLGALGQKIGAPNLAAPVPPVPTDAQWSGMTAPTNTAQQIGGLGEKAAEFMIPGGAEEWAGRQVGRLAPKIAPLARTAAAAVGSGAVNKVQGGDFGSGAAMGGVGGAIGEGLRAVAPKLAESALGIRKQDRFYGKTPGAAIMDDTKGFTPAAVAASSRAKLGDLTNQVESMATASPNRPSLQPARDVIAHASQVAEMRNNGPEIEQLKNLIKPLSENYMTGLPLSAKQTPTGMLNLKRGFGDQVGTWNPEISRGVSSIGRKAYRALDNEFDNAVPGAAEMNQRISSLIPVAKRAESVGNNAGLVQKGVHRVAAHTGAAASGLTGGYAGYKEGGLPGAVTGGMLGLAIPELLTSPTSQMIAARSLNSPATGKVIRAAGGGLLSGGRSKKKDDDDLR